MTQITPAVLQAILDGDIENAIAAATPGGIEAQEARGQRDFVANETLPRKCNFCFREQLMRMGIAFGEPVDDLFISVQLPSGWTKKATSHSMWSELLDEKGRKRASVFYKAAFYDRDAFVDLVRRFSCGCEPVGGWEKSTNRSKWHGFVRDCGETVWQTDETLGPQPEEKEQYLAWSDSRQVLAGKAEDWLNENWPDWKDPLAYWDEEK